MKKKILFLTVKFDISGGIEKITYDIITHLDPKKYDITLMSMYGGGYYCDRLPKYVHVKHFFPRFIRGAIRLVEYLPGKMVYRHFIKEKYDIEIACGDDIPSRVINHSVNPNSKKIAWIHMDVTKRGYRGHGMRTARGRAKFYSNFDHIVNVSKECEVKFKEKFGDRLPTCTIYNPIPTNEIIEKSKEQPLIDLPKDRFNLICCGRLTAQKGYDRLLDACAQLPDELIKKCHLTFLGDGVDRKLLEDRIKQYGFEEFANLHGFVENPYSILKQADLFVLSSRDESFALVVAEAMVLGVPVISTRCTGPVELLRNGEAGFLVDNSTEAIKDGLNKVLSDNAFYSELCEKAKRNRNNFSMQKQIDEIEELFDRQKVQQ